MTGALATVDAASVEKALAALWEENGGQPDGSPLITRACQLNLLICCHSPALARAAERTLEAISAECPSRALLAVVDEQPGVDRLEAAVGAHCAVRGEAGRHVCCEQVTLTGSGRGAARLPGVMLPLLLPDLPVSVWYPLEPVLEGDSVLAQLGRGLAAMADRLVVDARCFADPWRTLGMLAALRVPVGDLSWQRLRGWREMTAALFDGAAFESHPGRVSRLRVTWAVPAGSGPPGGAPDRGRGGAGEAILLGCWAASRLGWSPRGPAGRGAPPGETILLDRPRAKGEGRLELAGIPSGHPAGQVLSFEMEAGDALFRLERSEVLDCVTATVTMPEACPIPRSGRVPERDDAALLCRTLEPGGTDPVHREALHLAARLGGPVHGDLR